MGRTRPAARGGGVRALNAHCAANAHVLSDASDGEGGDGDEPPAARRRLAPVGLRPLAWLLARRRPRGHLPAPVLSCKHGHWRLLAAAFQSAPSRPARFVTSLTTPPRAIWPHERAPGRACVRLFPTRRRQGAPRFYQKFDCNHTQRLGRGVVGRVTSDDRHFRPLSCASSAPERTARRVCGSSRLVTVSL